MIKIGPNQDLSKSGPIPRNNFVVQNLNFRVDFYPMNKEYCTQKEKKDFQEKGEIMLMLLLFICNININSSIIDNFQFSAKSIEIENFIYCAKGGRCKLERPR